MPIIEPIYDFDTDVFDAQNTLSSENVIDLAHHLYMHGLLHKVVFEELENLRRMDSSEHNIVNHFVRKFCVENRLPLQSLLEEISDARYRIFVEQLFHVAQTNGDQLQRIRKIDVNQLGNRQFLNHFYSILKKFHNDPKHTYNERLALFCKFEKQIGQAITCAKDPDMQMHLIDKHVALLAAHIDFLTIKYKPDLHSYSIFKKLEKIINRRNSGASSNLIPEIVFCGRKAIALAIAGKFYEGEELMDRMDFLMTNFCTLGREFGNIIYFKIYFKLWKYEKYPSKDLKESILNDGEIGLAQEGLCPDETREFWKAHILIKLIYCLVGLGNKGNPIEIKLVSHKDIAQAEKLMNSKHLANISPRRKMQVSVAKARILELNGQPREAKIEIREAENIAIRCNYEEAIYISEYKKGLEVGPNISSIGSSPHFTDVLRTHQTDSRSVVGDVVSIRQDVDDLGVSDNTETTEYEILPTFDSMSQSFCFSSLLESKNITSISKQTIPAHIVFEPPENNFSVHKIPSIIAHCNPGGNGNQNLGIFRNPAKVDFRSSAENRSRVLPEIRQHSHEEFESLEFSSFSLISGVVLSANDTGEGKEEQQHCERLAIPSDTSCSSVLYDSNKFEKLGSTSFSGKQDISHFSSRPDNPSNNELTDDRKEVENTYHLQDMDNINTSRLHDPDKELPQIMDCNCYEASDNLQVLTTNEYPRLHDHVTDTDPSLSSDLALYDSSIFQNLQSDSSLSNEDISHNAYRGIDSQNAQRKDKEEEGDIVEQGSFMLSTSSDTGLQNSEEYELL